MINARHSEEDESIIKCLAGMDSLEKTKNSRKFSYICNNDRTLRWIFPNELDSPTFLNFFSVASIKSLTITLCIKFVYLIRLKKLIRSGEIEIDIHKDSILNSVLTKYKHDSFSIFTGTIGANRKAIIELNKNKKTFTFIKVALKNNSKVLVGNEIKTLNFIKSLELKLIRTPKLLNRSIGTIAELENVKPKKFSQNKDLTNLHINALNELYDKTQKNEKWNELYVLYKSKRNISNVEKNHTFSNGLIHEDVKRYCSKLNLAADLLVRSEKSVTVSTAHGDFTTWNMYVTKDKIHLFDWELSEEKMPMMYDLIHFVFQSNILIKRKGYKEITKELNLMLKRNRTQLMLKKYKIDFKLNYRFYLIYTFSYYLDKYVNQKNLHDQVFWMLRVWNEAITDLIDNNSSVFDVE